MWVRDSFMGYTPRFCNRYTVVDCGGFTLAFSSKNRTQLMMPMGWDQTRLSNHSIAKLPTNFTRCRVNKLFAQYIGLLSVQFSANLGIFQ